MNMWNRAITFLVLLAGVCFSASMSAQSYAFGIKGGLTAGIQQWDGQDRSLLFKGHGVLFIESAEEDQLYSIFCESGVHQRGSAIRNSRIFDVSGNLRDFPTQEYIFNNVSLSLGAKSRKVMQTDLFAYYGLAVRGEYTFDTNLDTYQERLEQIYGPNILLGYPRDEFVRKWNYGITVLGGFEYHMSEFVAGVVELRVSPDFSAQYLQPPIANAYDPHTGNTRNFQEQKAVNVSIELTIGLRFLRKIIYID